MIDYRVEADQYEYRLIQIKSNKKSGKVSENVVGHYSTRLALFKWVRERFLRDKTKQGIELHRLAEKAIAQEEAALAKAVELLTAAALSAGPNPPGQVTS